MNPGAHSRALPVSACSVCLCVLRGHTHHCCLGKYGYAANETKSAFSGYCGMEKHLGAQLVIKLVIKHSFYYHVDIS